MMKVHPYIWDFKIINNTRSNHATRANTKFMVFITQPLESLIMIEAK